MFLFLRKFKNFHRHEAKSLIEMKFEMKLALGRRRVHIAFELTPLTLQSFVERHSTLNQLCEQQVKFLTVNFFEPRKIPNERKIFRQFPPFRCQFYLASCETISTYELHCKFDFRTVYKPTMCFTFIPNDLIFRVVQFLGLAWRGLTR
jgi:hypothetical protein